MMKRRSLHVLHCTGNRLRSLWLWFFTIMVGSPGQRGVCDEALARGERWGTEWVGASGFDGGFAGRVPLVSGGKASGGEWKVIQSPPDPANRCLLLRETTAGRLETQERFFDCDSRNKRPWSDESMRF